MLLTHLQLVLMIDVSIGKKPKLFSQFHTLLHVLWGWGRGRGQWWGKEQGAGSVVWLAHLWRDKVLCHLYAAAQVTHLQQEEGVRV